MTYVVIYPQPPYLLIHTYGKARLGSIQYYNVLQWIGLVIKTAHVIKFIYSEKATKFCEISTLLLSYVVPVKSKVEISQNFVAFSEYMNFTLKFLALKETVFPP